MAASVVATALVAVLMNERFPAAFATIAAVINVGVRPFRECLLENEECEFRISLFNNAANLEAEQIVQQINRAEMFEPVKIMRSQRLEGERAVLKKLRMKCKEAHS